MSREHIIPITKEEHMKMHSKTKYDFGLRVNIRYENKGLTGVSKKEHEEIHGINRPGMEISNRRK